MEKDDKISRTAYFSDDLQQRFLLEIQYEKEAAGNIAVILMNPKNDEIIATDDVLNQIENLLGQSKYPTLQSVKVVNLFPFIEQKTTQLSAQISIVDLHQLNEFKQNLAMIKSVLKSADKIVLAWGSLTEYISNQKLQIAIADVYHLIRVFNKLENCYVFSLVGVDERLDNEGNPFHPIQGEINGIIPIEKLWMENNCLNYRFTKLSFI